MKTYLLLSLLLPAISSSAQHIEQFYDYKWRASSVENAVFYSLTEREGDRFHRMDYYVRQKKLQMNGYYADSLCKIRQGDFLYYYPGGNLETKCSYVNNKYDGPYLSFYDNGMMKDSSRYQNGNLVGNSFSWHPDGMMKDSTVMNEDGSGVSVSWHDNGNPSAAGLYGPGGKMRGTWKFFHHNGNLSSNELYNNGKLLDKKYFDENGDAEKDTASTDREVAFPGGSKAWMKYLYKHAYFPEGWKIVNSEAVVVLVSAVIDEDGKVTDAYVSSPFHPAFDDIALRVMRASPKWIPAIVHHRRIKAAVRQPITFAQSE